MNLVRKLGVARALIGLLVLGAGGCGYSKSTSSSTSSGLSGSATIQDDSPRMAGYWFIDLVDCEPTGKGSSGAVYVEQDGKSITFVFERGIEMIRLEGKLDGKKFRVSGTVMQAELETVETYEGTLADSGVQAFGVATDLDTRTKLVIRCTLRMARKLE